MRHALIIALSAAISLLPGVAVSQFGNVPWRVAELPEPRSFEIAEGFSAMTSRFWCEAGRYAVKKYGATGSERIYVLNPYGASVAGLRGRAVGFTLSPDQALLEKAANAGGNSLSVKMVGYNISVGHARGYCGLDANVFRM